MKLFSRIAIAVLLAAGISFCAAPRLGTISTTPVKTGNYEVKRTGIAYQTTYITIFGFAVTDVTNFAATASQMQEQNGCSYLRNAQLDYRQSGALGVGIQAYAMTADCMVEK